MSYGVLLLRLALGTMFIAHSIVYMPSRGLHQRTFDEEHHSRPMLEIDLVGVGTRRSDELEFDRPSLKRQARATAISESIPAPSTMSALGH